jgi:hypothetical protein
MNEPPFGSAKLIPLSLVHLGCFVLRNRRSLALKFYFMPRKYSAGRQRTASFLAGGNHVEVDEAMTLEVEVQRS